MSKCQPPNINISYKNFKAKNQKKIKSKPKNKEVYNLLISNPYLTYDQRRNMIRKNCNFIMPRKINF